MTWRRQRRIGIKHDSGTFVKYLRQNPYYYLENLLRPSFPVTRSFAAHGLRPHLEVSSSGPFRRRPRASPTTTFMTHLKPIAVLALILAATLEMRGPNPILAICYKEKTQRWLNLSFGVIPVHQKEDALLMDEADSVQHSRPAKPLFRFRYADIPVL